MKLREVFGFEIEYRLRQLSTWLYAAILLGVPFLMLHAIDGGDVHINAPEIIATVSTVLGMVGMLVTAALMGDAAIRDVQHGLHPLFYTLPLRRLDYLGGRFLGALLVNAVLLMGIPLGILLGSLMPYMPDEMFGPFRAATYVQPYVLLLLPNLILSAALLFTVAALTRQMLAAYVSGLLLFVGYILAGDMIDGLGNRTLAALLDPFGVSVLENLTRYWTVVEQNTRHIGFPPLLVWNRVVWLAVAVVALVLLHQRFRFAHPVGGRWPWKRRGEVTDPGLQRPVPVSRAAVSPEPAERRFGAGARVRQTLSVTGQALRQVLANRAVLVVLGGLLIVVVRFGWEVSKAVFGTTTWPVTHLIAGRALTIPMEMFVPILIALVAGELVWREREVGLAEMIDTAPVPDWVPILGRFLALVVLLVALQVVLLPIGVALQALQGYYNFELGLYVQILFGLNLPDALLFAALALAVHVIVDNKYVGHLVVVLYFLFTANAGKFDIEHNLLLYGSDPGWVYSDMSGFGPFIGPVVWFKLYWAGWALLLAVVANLFWVRGPERGLRRRAARARGRFTRGAAGAVAVASLAILTLGGFIFYNTNILNEYRTGFESNALRAEYERRYERYSDAAQPQIVGAALRVELYPDESAAEMRGTYHLVNDTEEPIDSVHVIVDREVRPISLAFDGGAELVLEDDELSYRIFHLHRPLQPGDSTRLTFDLAFRPAGFRNGGMPTEVAGNGAYIQRRWLPIIGYQTELELTRDRRRREHGLEPKPRMPAMDDPTGLRERGDLRDADVLHVETVIGADADQVAVTTGKLVREWREDGRRYFHYRTDVPVAFGAPVLSAEYDVHEDRWGDVALQIFHHPSHTFNLDRMVRSMKASLEYFTTNFGPYPYDQLRVVEFPRYSSFARAHPHTITFSEGSAFLTRVNEGDVDRPFFVIAHEVAHQWWGGQVRGARVEGAAFLSESLAMYSAMMVMERTYGVEQVRKFYEYEMDRYLQGRRVFTNREVPLLEVQDQNFLYYHKGAVAMYTLREHIGADAVNAALRRYHDAYVGAGPPYPTTRDLYRELRAETPDSLQSLLYDLFETATLWDVRTLAASAAPAGAGKWQVTLEVEARKVRADSAGSEREVPMHDLVEIAVFAPADGAGGGRGVLGEALYLERHRIGSGRQTITVTVSGRPAVAGIDPQGKLIQLETGDNTMEVRTGEG